MTTRSNSIKALLARSAKDVARIEQEYKDSLDAKRVSDELCIDIKNLCGNLRSVLDYLASDIREIHCPNARPKERFYFPVLPARAQFEARMAQWFPDLEVSSPDVWNYLESIQPYHDVFQWLGHLNRVNNENKHEALVEQTRTETERVSVTTKGGGQVSWTPASVQFGNGVFIGGVPVDPNTQMPVPHPSQTVERVVWVDFRFADLKVSALALLKAATDGVRAIADDLSKWV